MISARAHGPKQPLLVTKLPCRYLAFRYTSYPLSVSLCRPPGWRQDSCTAQATHHHTGLYFDFLFSAWGRTQGLLSTKCSITDFYLKPIKKKMNQMLALCQQHILSFCFVFDKDSLYVALAVPELALYLTHRDPLASPS